MKQRYIAGLFVVSSLFWLAGCQANESPSNSDVRNGYAAAPDTGVGRGLDTTEPTPAAPAAKSRGGAGNRTDPPGAASHQQDEDVLRNWPQIVEEYHEILCRQHRGMNTTEDKIRMAEVTRQIEVAKQKLPSTEQVEFASSLGKAVDMGSCP